MWKCSISTNFRLNTSHPNMTLNFQISSKILSTSPFFVRISQRRQCVELLLRVMISFRGDFLLKLHLRSCTYYNSDQPKKKVSKNLRLSGMKPSTKTLSRLYPISELICLFIENAQKSSQKASQLSAFLRVKMLSRNPTALVISFIYELHFRPLNRPLRP